MADANATKVSQGKTPTKVKGRSPEEPIQTTATDPYGGILSLQQQVGNQAVGHILEKRADNSSEPIKGLPPVVQSVLNSNSGKPLDPETRRYMESRFRDDFSQVRIHTDTKAAESAKAVDAVAYTVKQDVVLDGGNDALSTEAGQYVLAHELAHVVQQSRSDDATLSPSTNSSLEQSANRAASTFTQGNGTVQVDGASAPGLACMTVQEAEQKLGRFVPDFIKQRAKPLVEGLHTVVDPKAELPKPVEAIVHETAAAAAVILPSTPAEAPSSPPSSPAQNASSPPSPNQKKPTTKPPTVGTNKSQEAPVSTLISVTEKVKGLARDKLLGGLGTVKGVATQVTEVVDTALWVGGEYRHLRDTAAQAIGGKEGSTGNQIVSGLIDALPGTQNLQTLADANDSAKAIGLVDKQSGQTSLTAPMSDKLNEAGKWVENKVGGAPSDPTLFTPMEAAELEAAISTQVALAFTGAEEVKVAMNVIGAIGGLRGVVETIRAHPDSWYKDSAFWSSLIGMALSIVGLKHSMAASKITTLILKFGWVAAAIPPLTQMAADYTNTQLSEEERDKRMKRNWGQALHVLKDAILHVAQSQGGKPATGEVESSTSPSKPRVGATGEVEIPGSSSTAAKGAEPPVAAPKPSVTAVSDTAPSQAPAAPITAKPALKPPAIGSKRSYTGAANDNDIPLVPSGGATSGTGEAKVVPIDRARAGATTPKPPKSPAPTTGKDAEVIPIGRARKPTKQPQEQPQIMVEEQPLAATGTGDASPTILGNQPPGKVSTGLQGEPTVAMANSGSKGSSGGKPAPPIAPSPTKGTSATPEGGTTQKRSSAKQRLAIKKNMSPEERRRVEVLELFEEARGRKSPDQDFIENLDNVIDKPRGSPPIEAMIKGRIAEKKHQAEIFGELKVPTAQEHLGKERLRMLTDQLELERSISIQEFAKNLPPQGAEQVMLKTSDTDRVIDHMYPEGNSVILRESKSVRELNLEGNTKSAEKLRTQLDKDIELTRRYDGAIVEWRVDGLIGSDTKAILSQLVSENSGRFRVSPKALLD